MGNFLNQWDNSGEQSSRIGIRFHHAPSLKHRLSEAIYRLKVQQNKLESTAMRMHQHDRDIFAKCVAAQMAHDTARAAMYANECAEVRKIAKVTVQSQMALEQVALRLETIEEFGDVARMMGPVTSVVRSVKSQISGIVPEVGFELTEVGELLNNFVVEAGEPIAGSYDVSASNEAAQKILSEANAVADQHLKDKFPELPDSPSRIGESLSR